MKNRILRDYSGKADAPVGDFALHVAASLNGNANFTTPPITSAALTTQATAFNTSVGKAINGTPADTLDKNTKRVALITALDTLANYVELMAVNDAAKMISAGFDLVNMSRTQAVPEKSSIVSVTNVASGKLGLDLAVGANAWAYVVEYSALPNGAVKNATFTNPHEAVLTGLTPGTVYSMRVQVMGSGNQVTEWSDTVQHMAT